MKKDFHGLANRLHLAKGVTNEPKKININFKNLNTNRKKKEKDGTKYPGIAGLITYNICEWSSMRRKRDGNT